MSNDVKLVPAICTQCGANVTVNPETEAAVCKFCGTPFVVERAINKYYITNHIQNTTIVNRNVKRSIWDYCVEETENQRRFDADHPEAKKQREKEAQFGVIAAGILAVLIAIIYVAIKIGMEKVM